MKADPSDRPATWGETLAGVLIFVQFPLIYYFMIYIYPTVPGEEPPNWLQNLVAAILFLGIWFVIPLVGIAIGWVKGFPRWVYPYVAFAVLDSLYLMNASTPGISIFGLPLFGRELWGVRACLPGLFMVAVVLALTRFSRPLWLFFVNGWKDWTRFTYALFGLMPLINFVSFDEIADSYEMPFQAGLIVIMVLAAAAYLRSATPTGRVLSLLAGFGLCVLIDTIAPTLYWLENDGVDVRGMVTYAIGFMVLVFLPAAIGLFRRLTTPIPPSTA